jgi:hypothetical protein
VPSTAYLPSRRHQLHTHHHLPHPHAHVRSVGTNKLATTEADEPHRQIRKLPRCLYPSVSRDGNHSSRRGHCRSRCDGSTSWSWRPAAYPPPLLPPSPPTASPMSCAMAESSPPSCPISSSRSSCPTRLSSHPTSDANILPVFFAASAISSSSSEGSQMDEPRRIRGAASLLASATVSARSAYGRWGCHSCWLDEPIAPALFALLSSIRGRGETSQL